jgi:hypothetical protein
VALRQADPVFEGTVIVMKTLVSEGDFMGRRYALTSWPEVAFQAKRRWKGNVDSIVYLRSDDWSHAGGGCGFEFVMDSTYLVYAYKNKGNLETSICSRTALIGRAQADLDSLGPGRPIPE